MEVYLGNFLVIGEGHSGELGVHQGPVHRHLGQGIGVGAGAGAGLEAGAESGAGDGAGAGAGTSKQERRPTVETTSVPGVT